MRHVRVALEVVALAVGALVTIVAVWLAVFAVTAPECSIDPAEPQGRLALGLWTGGVVLTEVGVAIAAVRRYRRGEAGQTRTLVAFAFPVAQFVAFVVWGGLLSIALLLLGASDATAACM